MVTSASEIIKKRKAAEAAKTRAAKAATARDATAAAQQQRPGFTPPAIVAQKQTEAAAEISAKAQADRQRTDAERMAKARRLHEATKAKARGKVGMPAGAKGTGQNAHKTIAAAICELDALSIAAQLDNSPTEVHVYEGLIASLAAGLEEDESTAVGPQVSGQGPGINLVLNVEGRGISEVDELLDTKSECEYVEMVDVACGGDDSGWLLGYTVLKDEPKGPERFLGSHAGPSDLRLQGFPLRAAQDCVLDSRTQTTVPVRFEDESVRPATDFMVETTPRDLASLGLVTAKVLINGAQQETALPIINATKKRIPVTAGMFLGWAFPLGPHDRILPVQGDGGKMDVMPLRPQPIRKVKRQRGPGGRMVNSIAIEDPDEGAEEAVKVSTDPNLEVYSSDEETSEEEVQEFVRYQIKERSLKRKQK